MKKSGQNLLAGCPFFYQSYTHLINEIIHAVETRTNCLIVTPTTEILGASLSQKNLYRILKEKATILLPDSVSLIGLARLRGKSIKHRLTGIDTLYLLGQEPNRSFRVYYIGATTEHIQKAVKRSAELFPSFEVVGSHHGYFTKDQEPDLIDDINQAHPDLLFVGMGFPKQEQFVADYEDLLDVPVKITVGGSFDVISGAIRRAPRWMQKVGLEWAYRMIQEPFRLGRLMVIPWYLWRIFWTDFRRVS